MTLDEFVEKYNGKKVDFDGAYGAQCVDLFRQYNKDVFGLPHTGAVGGAEQLFTKYASLPVEAKYYERVECGANTIPEPGDAAVFGPCESNKYGHVAIVLEANQTGMTVFEQDGFRQELGAHKGVWGYMRCLGFLRRRREEGAA